MVGPVVYVAAAAVVTGLSTIFCKPELKTPSPTGRPAGSENAPAPTNTPTPSEIQVQTPLSSVPGKAADNESLTTPPVLRLKQRYFGVQAELPVDEELGRRVIVNSAGDNTVDFYANYCNYGATLYQQIDNYTGTLQVIAKGKGNPVIMFAHTAPDGTESMITVNGLAGLKRDQFTTYCFSLTNGVNTIIMKSAENYGQSEQTADLRASFSFIK